MADFSAMSDRELLLNTPPDSGKIAELISRYMKTVFACARKYSDIADYEELVSDGMEGLLAAVKSYNGEKGEFSAFVSVCIDNKLKSTARKSLKRTSKLAHTDPEELETIADPSPTPEEIVIARENSESVFNIMRSELTALELRCIECAAMGLSYNEIADRLDVDRKTVDNALTRARAKLRRHYAG